MNDVSMVWVESAKKKKKHIVIKSSFYNVALQKKKSTQKVSTYSFPFGKIFVLVCRWTSSIGWETS